MSKKKTDAFSAKSLEDKLWETFKGLESGDVPVEKAHAVAKLSQGILNITKTKLAVMKHVG